MIGTAEDHHSNPLKIAIGEVQARGGGRFISINPVRTGYSAIADEWIPIKPGTDGALFMALLHELIAQRPDRPRVPEALTPTRRSSCVLDDGAARGHVRARPRPGEGPAGRRPRAAQQAGLRHARRHDHGGLSRRHRRRLRSGARRPLHARRRHARSRRRSSCCASASRRARRSGRRRSPASRPARIRKLARELGDDRAAAGVRAADRLDRRLGQAHATTQARPVAFHAMRGLAAHSNGFQTVRALAVLMSVLGTIDAPGGFRHKAPYPRHIVPNYRAFNSPDDDPAEHAAQRGAARLSGQPATSWRSTTTARRCASTTRSRGSTRCRRTG